MPLAYNHSGFEANENSSDYGLGFNYGRLIGRDMASFAKWTAECLPSHHSFYPLSFHDVHLRRLRGKSFETTCRTQTSPDNWQYVHQMLNQRPIEIMQKWHQEYGTMLTIRYGRQLAISVSNLDIAHGLLSKRGAIFSLQLVL